MANLFECVGEKLTPVNKKDIWCYMLMVVAFMPLIYIVAFWLAKASYMMLNVIALIAFVVIFIVRAFIYKPTFKSMKEYFKSPAFVIMTILFAWIVFSNFFAYDMVGSWFGFVNGAHIEVSVFQYIFYYVVAICAINLKKENINYVLNLFIYVATAIIVFQFITLDYSFAFIHKNHTGYYLIMTLMLTIGKFLKSNKLLDILVSAAIIVLHFASLIANGSMGPLLAVVVFFVICLIYFAINKRQYLLKLLSIITCFFLVMCVIDYTPKLKDIRDEKFTTIEKFEGIALVGLNKIGLVSDEYLNSKKLPDGSDGYSRFDMWERSVENMKEHPLFGVGMSWKEYNPDMPNMKPHNEFLQYGAMCGIPAMVAYIALMLYLMIIFGKQHKTASHTSFVLMSAIFAYLVQSIFGNAMPFVSPTFFLLVGLAIKLMDTEQNNV